MNYHERLKFNGLTMQDAISGSLPTIDLLEENMADRLKRAGDAEPRAIAAIRYAEQERQKFPPILDLDKLAFPEQDTLSILYLDAVAYMGNDRLMDLYRRRLDKGESKKDVPFHKQRRNIVKSRKGILNDLYSFTELYAGADTEQVHEGLGSVFYEAFCLVLNEAGLPNRVFKPYKNMRGLLAEVKLVKNLQEMGLAAEFSDEDGDRVNGEDVVVWLDHNHYIAFQVKSSYFTEAELSITQEKDGVLLAEVPTRPEVSWLYFNGGEKQRLFDTVRDIANGHFSSQRPLASV